MSDEKIIRDGKNFYKISFDKNNKFKVTITDNDLTTFNNLLETDYTKIVNDISTALIKEKELKMLQMIIKKQEKELKNLRKGNPDYSEFYLRGYFDGELKYKGKISILINHQMESLNYIKKTDESYQTKIYIINLLKSLLKEENNEESDPL